MENRKKSKLEIALKNNFSEAIKGIYDSGPIARYAFATAITLFAGYVIYSTCLYGFERWDECLKSQNSRHTQTR